jgi:hypothetical protein
VAGVKHVPGARYVHHPVAGLRHLPWQGGRHKGVHKTNAAHESTRANCMRVRHQCGKISHYIMSTTIACAQAALNYIYGIIHNWSHRRRVMTGLLCGSEHKWYPVRTRRARRHTTYHTAPTTCTCTSTPHHITTPRYHTTRFIVRTVTPAPKRRIVRDVVRNRECRMNGSGRLGTVRATSATGAR